MSQLIPDSNLPPIESVDGFVTDASMILLSSGIESTLDQFGDAIGNLHGEGDYQYEASRFINNLGSSIGTMMHDPAYPFGALISNISEAFTLTNRKYAVLSLVADTNITPVLSLGGYTFVNGLTSMTSDTHFTIVGRVLYFKKMPTLSFSITYTGYAPSSNNTDPLYKPNLLPNPASTTFTRPTLALNSGRIEVTIGTADAIETTTALDGQYEVFLSTYLNQFISPSGAILCPLAYISAYKFNSGTGMYSKINCTEIRIINSKQYQLTTGDVINLATDIIVISISNTGIWDWLTTTVRELQEHKHDSSDISSPLLHADLIDTIPISSNANIQYGKSITAGSDHPQYLNREGYSETDIGTYGNAMLGDMFMASTDIGNRFNNVNSRSNRLIFGETSGSGHSVFRNAASTTDDLEINSSSNGIYVSYQHTNAAKTGIRMSSSGGGGSHNISNKANTNDLLVGSATERTVFGNQTTGRQDIEGRSIYFASATLSGSLTMPTGSDLYLGSVDIGVDYNAGATVVNITDTNVLNNAKIVSVVPFDLDVAVVNRLDVVSGLLKPGSKIYFGADVISPSSYILSKNNKMVYVSDFSLDIEGSGVRNGLNFQKDANRYMTIYTAANDGSVASPADNNGFIEIEGGELYLIRPTDEVITVDTVTHSFQNNSGTVRIDDLDKWIRSDLFVNKLVSSRLEFGIYNAITSTVNQAGNSNKIIVHSNNGVLFSRDQSEDYAVAVLDKCDITVKDVHADNVITDIITAETSNIKHIEIPSDGTDIVLRVLGNSVFNAPTSIQSTLTVASTLYTSSIDNAGNIRTNSMQVAGNISTDTLSVLKSVAFAGISSVDAEFSSLKISDKIEFTQTGKEIRMNNGAIIGLQMPSISSNTDVPNKGYVDSQIVASSGGLSAALAQEIIDRTNADNTKANLAGSTLQVFRVANGVDPNDAVNKGQLDGLVMPTSGVTIADGARHGINANIRSSPNFIGAGTDLNAIRNSGIYYVDAGCTNKPPFCGNGVLFCDGNDGGDVGATGSSFWLQRFINDSDGRSFSRRISGGASNSDITVFPRWIEAFTKYRISPQTSGASTTTTTRNITADDFSSHTMILCDTTSGGNLDLIVPASAYADIQDGQAVHVRWFNGGPAPIIRQDPGAPPTPSLNPTAPYEFRTTSVTASIVYTSSFGGRFMIIGEIA